MPSELTPIDRSIIKNMMLSRSYKDISDVLGVSICLVSDCVKDFVAESGLITKQQKLDNKRLTRPDPVVKERAPKVKQPVKKIRKEGRTNVKFQQQVRREERKRALPAYATKQIDYTKMVMVRIDRTTAIYARPGEEEKTKNEFLKKYIRPLDRVLKNDVHS